MHSVEFTVIQKVLCGLFALTIISSVICLGFFFIEKPDKVTIKCEVRSGLKYTMQPVKLDVNHPEDINSMQRVENCTTTTNPPISANHLLVTDIATISGALFISTAIVAYILRKRDPLDPHDLPE